MKNSSFREYFDSVHYGRGALWGAVAASGLLALSACSAPEPVGEQYSAAPDEPAVTPLVPARYDADGTPLLEDGDLHHRDYSAVQHALASVGRVMRDSEMGHEAYRPELADEPMGRQGEAWLAVQDEAGNFMTSDGFAGTRFATDDGWAAGRNSRLDELAQAAFSYHMHHSAGRFEDHGLYDAITWQAAPYLAAIPLHVLENHYRDGVFCHVDGRMDAASMAQGLDVLHSLSYSWVRWHIPGGADDMGEISEERMAESHGIERDELLDVARALADTLDNSWDDQNTAYDFGGGTHYALDDLGSLIRGHKGLYEILYIFGDSADAEQAARLFDRMVDMVLAVAEAEAVVQPWGMAASVAFTADGVEPASDRVDTAAQWRFVNHLTGGFGPLRERDGMSDFLADRPAFAEAVGELNDTLFEGALEHQLQDGLMVRRLDFNTGEISDAARQVENIGWFATAVGNGYRSGEAFDRPGSWDDDEALAERSRALYDTLRDHNDWLLERVDP